MWTPDYFVRLVDLPEAAHGVTVPNDDGTFDIYINARLSEEQRRRCLEHELTHIRSDHFYSSRPVAELEREADGKPARPDLTGPPANQVPYFPTLEAFQQYVRELESSFRP